MPASLEPRARAPYGRAGLDDSSTVPASADDDDDDERDSCGGKGAPVAAAVAASTFCCDGKPENVAKYWLASAIKSVGRLLSTCSIKSPSSVRISGCSARYCSCSIFNCACEAAKRARREYAGHLVSAHGTRVPVALRAAFASPCQTRPPSPARPYATRFRTEACTHTRRGCADASSSGQARRARRDPRRCRRTAAHRAELTVRSAVGT